MEAANQTRLCRLDEVGEGESLGLTADCDGRLLDVFVVRKDGALYAYHNSCPHTGGPLDWVPGRFLSLDRQHIQCATHAAMFRIQDGLCVSGPCSGHFLTALEITVTDGNVYLSCSETRAGSG